MKFKIGRLEVGLNTTVARARKVATTSAFNFPVRAIFYFLSLTFPRTQPALIELLFHFGGFCGRNVDLFSHSLKKGYKKRNHYGRRQPLMFQD